MRQMQCERGDFFYEVPIPEEYTLADSDALDSLRDMSGGCGTYFGTFYVLIYHDDEFVIITEDEPETETSAEVIKVEVTCWND